MSSTVNEITPSKTKTQYFWYTQTESFLLEVQIWRLFSVHWTLTFYQQTAVLLQSLPKICKETINPATKIIFFWTAICFLLHFRHFEKSMQQSCLTHPPLNGLVSLRAHRRTVRNPWLEITSWGRHDQKCRDKLSVNSQNKQTNKWANKGFPFYLPH